jgi:hypothetical protein
MPGRLGLSARERPMFVGVGSWPVTSRGRMFQFAAKFALLQTLARPVAAMYVCYKAMLASDAIN